MWGVVWTPNPPTPGYSQDSLTWYFLHFCTVLSLLKFSTVLYISTFCNFPTLSGSTLSNFWITSSVLSSSSATESVGASLKHLNEEATGLMRDFSTRNTRLLRVFTENTQRFARHETCRVVWRYKVENRKEFWIHLRNMCIAILEEIDDTSTQVSYRLGTDKYKKVCCENNFCSIELFLINSNINF